MDSDVYCISWMSFHTNNLEMAVTTASSIEDALLQALGKLGIADCNCITEEVIKEFAFDCDCVVSAINLSDL